MKVRVLRPALNDLVAGRRFYDRQEQGVGDYFFDSVFAGIDSLAMYAGIHRIIGGEAVVFRVLDCRRDPEKIRKALER
jgi:hypothetical protein